MMGFQRGFAAAVAVLAVTAVSGCAQWQGPNSLPLPGTEGGGADAYVIRAEMPDVDNLQRNSRVRVGDVTVGTVTKIELAGWDAMVTMVLNGDVELPANVTATLGQTSLLGSKHIELAPPVGEVPEGRLRDKGFIPLRSSSAYPTTEQTLAALSMLLNGGGIGQIQEITETLATAFAGRESEIRTLVNQLDTFLGHLSSQTADIIDATDSLNHVVSQFATQKPVLDRAIETIPEALSVLRDERATLVEAWERFGRFSALAADATLQTKDALVKELQDIGPVLQSLADSGPALTRSMDFFSTFPYPKNTLEKWVRGDYANLTAIIDLTLSRLDSSLFTGTRWEGNLTELEIQWGRTIGQLPSPYTAGNPLVAPYHFDGGS
ncbi:MCE family protein [[Mycobacterium] wendilense]|uniref:MCE family protein n=1 Tax=[Mycobacterium] wendilense TaxID=3064284 RepID=A0ABM9MIK3_9MYCO|nr:MCE family protein [Mycolicibacterium sp. MU0050]CAJ1586079.1 MCE family protein [Mycolicibacterium sp. MU0050]